MKAPIKPLLPVKPRSPDTHVLKLGGFRVIETVSDGDLLNLNDLPKENGLLPTIQFILDVTNSDEYSSYSSASLHIKIGFKDPDSEIPNPNYEKLHEMYLYKLEQYEKDIIKYNQKLKKYQEDLPKYEIYLKEKQIKHAKEILKKYEK